jgi:hypothetical protein
MKVSHLSAWNKFWASMRGIRWSDKTTSIFLGYLLRHKAWNFYGYFFQFNCIWSYSQQKFFQKSCNEFLFQFILILTCVLLCLRAPFFSYYSNYYLFLWLLMFSNIL